jgi:hypothetical protein
VLLLLLQWEVFLSTLNQSTVSTGGPVSASDVI